ncbi:MAG: hypothetical protein ACYSVY_23630 [Planctomycetota bacterium]
MSKTTKEPPSRLACRIAESAFCNRSRNAVDALTSTYRALLEQWETMRHRQARAAKAIGHGWLLAAGRVLSEGRFDRDPWSPLWDKYCRTADSLLLTSPGGLGSSEVRADLQELANEFEDVGWDRHRLWVTTESIVLEDVYLGPFQIRLRLDRIANPTADGDDFDVVAVDPNPAGGNGEVTHPHVSGGRLCQGDATGPIRLAVQQGRLVDFFQLVHSVLRTYNSASPFVRLDEWDGVRCAECGAGVSSEATVCCGACGDDYCDECSSYCPACDETRCAACLIECRGCGESSCDSCLSACEGCSARGFCGSCLVPCQQCEREGFCDLCLKACAECEQGAFCVDCLEYDRCAACCEEHAEEDDDVDDDEGTDERQSVQPDAKPAAEIAAEGSVPAGAALHADGLAQAPVPVPCR